MSKLMAAALIAALALAMGYSAVLGQSWEFNADGDYEGWSATPNVTNHTVANGCLSGDVTSIDPYLVGPRHPHIDTSQYRYVIVRMRQTRGFMGQFYWGSQAEPWHSGDRQMYFGVKPDGFFHTYILDMSKDPAWTGMVNTPRVDPHEDDITGRFDIDYIRISKTAPALLTVTGPIVANRFACEGETMTVTAIVKNEGFSDAANVRATIAGQGITVLSAQPQTAAGIPAGQEATLTWQVRADSQSAAPLTLAIDSDSPGGAITSSAVLVVTAPLPTLAGSAPAKASAWTDAAGNAVIENDRVRMAFYKSSMGYAVGELFVRDGSQWSLMGASCPLSRLVYTWTDGSQKEIALLPSDVTTARTASGASLDFAYTRADLHGGAWSGHIIYSLDDGDSAVKASYTITCTAARNVAAWTGPSLYAGNRSYGEAKDEAVFPGLEWLDGHDSLPGGERSSNSLDMDPMFACRLAPHPYKVSVPLMAVASGGNTAGIEWDPMQAWDGTNRCPSAAFSSPNWYQGQANHMMELFVPSIPNWVGENATVAATPYPLAAGSTLRLEGYYYASHDGADVHRMFPDYYARFFGRSKGIPNAPALPGPSSALTDMLDDAREGYMGSLWDAAGPGWRIRYVPDITWPDTAPTADLFCESLYTTDPVLRAGMRDRVTQAANAAIAKFGITKLLTTSTSDIGEVHLPYFVGHLAESLGDMGSPASSALSKQRPDGSWTVPFDDKYPDLTTPRDLVFLGECAKNAQTILREARRTGSATLKMAGVKALTYMDRFRVAAGIPGSELPQHAPCLRAAQYAMASYLEGYLLTGDKSYLDRSVKWARAGLQFIYTWKATDRAMMNYADACYYGASYFIGTRWMGKSVPWISQIYAYYLERLSHYDSSMPWRTIAEGIARHSYQSMLASPHAHAYPDCIKLVEDNSVIGLYFIPEAPYKLAGALLDRTYSAVDIAVVTGPSKTAHISSCGKILLSTFPTSSQLNFKLGYRAAETANVLIYGVGEPVEVYKGTQALPKVSDVDTVSEGWAYNATYGCVIVKEIQGSNEQMLSAVIAGTP